MELIDKTKTWYRKLPEKKPYVEFITALLTVPVLLTVIILNVNSLKNNQKTVSVPTPAPTPVVTQTPSPTVGVTTPTPSAAVTQAPTPTVVAGVVCKKTVGPVNIAYPAEGDVVKTDPVNIDIAYQADGYCAVVWSYRINGASWSDYTDRSISLYGLPSGTKNLELRVKSIASGDEVVIKRSFTYVSPNATPTVSPSPVATSSATMP
jgi:hypothetical protein